MKTPWKTKIEELTHWLETHDIDDPEYADKFESLKRLEVFDEQTD